MADSLEPIVAATGAEEFTTKAQEAVDKKIRDDFYSTIERREDGYYVRLPWKEHHSVQLDNKALAYKCLNNETRRREQQKHKHYFEATAVLAIADKRIAKLENIVDEIKYEIAEAEKLRKEEKKARREKKVVSDEECVIQLIHESVDRKDEQDEENEKEIPKTYQKTKMHVMKQEQQHSSNT
ncbi:hypothetical protein GCK32_003688 [Trichostrongylus colubriformis]|uniref:Uncharacterized protein n=1 Tax=Trichostrongylus colubriformis TaxID=6319 RepID=A0AAN8ISL4_TRICO